MGLALDIVKGINKGINDFGKKAASSPRYISGGSSNKTSSSGSGSSKSGSSSGMSKGSDGKYYGKGGSGKEFGYNPQTGGIAITQNGQTRYVGVNDPNYAATKAAMQGDVGFSIGNLGKPSASSSSGFSSGSNASRPTSGGAYQVGSGSVGKTTPGVNYDKAQNIAGGNTGSKLGNAMVGGALGALVPGGNGFTGMMAGLLGSGSAAGDKDNAAATTPTPTPQAVPLEQLADGSYNASLGSQVSNENEGILEYDPADGSITRVYADGRRFKVFRGSEKYESILNEYIRRYGLPETMDAGYKQEEPDNLRYEPVDQSDYTDRIMGYDEAVDLAQQLLEPQFEQKMQQTATQVAQNLERSGMYDSLYGQALMQNAQNAVAAELESAVAELANQMVGESRQQMLQLLQLAVNDNQFGASYEQNNLLASMDYIQNSIKMLQDQANANRDYELARQAQELEARIVAGQITQTEAEIEYQKLQNRLLEMELGNYGAAPTAAGGGSGRSRSYSRDRDNDNGGPKKFEDGLPLATMTGTGLSEGGQKVLNQVLNARTSMDKESALMAGVVAGLIQNEAEARKIANMAGIGMTNLPSAL